MNKAMVALLACALLLTACDYIVLPEDLDEPAAAGSRGWSAVATNVTQTDAGDLHVDLAIRNETFDWSAMKALPDKPAVLRTGDGKTTPCDTVFVGTGGHRLAPGFQMRGYTAGTKAEPEIQPIYVECQGVQAGAGATLSIEYSYVVGEYNYYYPENSRVDATLEVSLDAVAADLAYPVAEPTEGLSQKPGTEITAINDVILILSGITRSEQGWQFDWSTSNPGEYPSYVHVGIPPVIGDDGVIYGFYESPDLESVPVTPAGDKAQWSTEVAVPQGVNGCYILLSVESKKQRLFVNYLVDLTDQ